jgi:hypothetical protein
MCQQCVKLGIANPPNKKGGVIAVKREKKKPAEGEDDSRGRRGKR